MQNHKVVMILWVILFTLQSCFGDRAKKSTGTDPIEYNMHGIIEKGYYIDVLIGTPPQHLNILIDTGSSNFAVASMSNPLISKYFIAADSTSLQKTGVANVDIRYTEGFWKGDLVSDIISIPTANFSVGQRVNFVEITDSEKFFINESGWQGILGMAYDDIIRPPNSDIKSFTSTVLGNSIMDNIFSLKLCKADVENFRNEVSGKFILGGFDRSLDRIYWTPIVKEWYYDVRVLGLKVGQHNLSVACSEFNNDKSIVDSGTTNLRFPTAIFKDIVTYSTLHISKKNPSLTISDKFWNGKDDLCWEMSQNPYSVFPIITVYLPSEELNHSISLFVHPIHYILFTGNTTQNSKSMACYKFGISPSDTGTVLGAVLMEQYNVIFDRANKRIGFSTSDCSLTSGIEYLQGYVNSTDCAYIKDSSLTTMQIVAYVMLGLVVLCMIPVLMLGCAWLSRQKTSRSSDASNLLSSSASD